MAKVTWSSIQLGPVIPSGAMTAVSSCFIGQNRFVLYAATLIRFSNKDAKKIVSEVGGVISEWQAVAHQHNAPAREIEYLSGAFEHADLEQAKKL